MRKRILGHVVIYTLASLVLLQSCRDDSSLAIRPAVPDQSFVEEFDTVSAALNRGWKITNASVPKLSFLWQQGGDVIPWFKAYSSNGAYEGFIGASAEIAAGLPGTHVVSNWLISPVVTMQNGDKITFYTRTRFLDPTDDGGNRLQLRVSKNGESLNVGSGLTVGDFGETLIDINPTYESQTEAAPSSTAFPSVWTKFEGTVSGLNEPVKGRFAFHYLIEDANTYGWGVGVDRVQYISASTK